MNCTRVQELLPLYVGEDLAVGQAAEVRAHLSQCAACQRLADEFAASQNWLQAVAPPEFDDAFFDNLRAGVWQRQAQLEAQPSLLERWLPFGSWRLMGAAAMTALLVAALWSWSVYRSGVAPAVNQGNELVRQPTGNGSKTPTLKDSLPENKQQLADTSNHPARHARGSVEIAPQLTELVSAQSSVVPGQQSLIAQANRPLPDDVPPLNPGEIPNPPEMPEMLRIELQTADPNIRIIWFAPKTETPLNTKPETNSR